MNDPLISVLVPVYKTEAYLARCVSSICNQTYKNLEIILVDDGSPDGSGALCDQLAQEDSRIRVIHKENGGLASTRNVGIDAMTGDYVAFIDSDDHIAPEMTPEGEAVYCLSCGYQIAEAADHTHVYAETWNSDDSRHWRECSCGTASESATHNWGSGEKDQNGNTVFTCSVCGASHIQEAPADQADDFPWTIVFIVLVIALLGSIVALVMVLKPRKPKSSK